MKTAVRVLLVSVFLGGPFALAQQGKPAKEPKPPTDNPPIGKAPLLLMEDFESTPAGEIPTGYTKQGAVAVDDTVAQPGLLLDVNDDPDVSGERPAAMGTGDVLVGCVGVGHLSLLRFRVVAGVWVVRRLYERHATDAKARLEAALATLSNIAAEGIGLLLTHPTEPGARYRV